jgi:predicted transposase/invertase (TIGR01784 family)
MKIKSRFINPFTDFGFKKIFGEEENKILLIDFLNSLLAPASPIRAITFLKNEHLSSSVGDRKAIFDLYCENEIGEKFIVELQKTLQQNFKDRSLYYACFALQEQAQTGIWNFGLKTVYVVSIMDFVFDDTNSTDYIHEVGLLNKKTNAVFNPHLQFVYLEMPKFGKKEAELNTILDKWVYNIKNLHTMKKLPSHSNEGVFTRLFECAEYLNMSHAQKMAYHESYKHYNDLKNSLDTKFAQGIEQGIEHGIEQGIEQGRASAAQEFAIKGLQLGVKPKKLSKQTGLSLDDLNHLARLNQISFKKKKK